MDEVKKIIRSILISSPVKIDCNKLNKDYNDVIGEPIPYRDFGYSNLLSFLQNIPDVLTINGYTLNSWVTPVVSEKASHINTMVCKQKKTGKAGGFSSTPVIRNRYKTSYTHKQPVSKPLTISPPKHTPIKPVSVNSDGNTSPTNSSSIHSNQDVFKQSTPNYTTNTQNSVTHTQNYTTNTQNYTTNTQNYTTNTQNYTTNTPNILNALRTKSLNSSYNGSITSQDTKSTTGAIKKDLHYLRRPKFHKNLSEHNLTLIAQSEDEIDSKHDPNDFMRELLLNKDKTIINQTTNEQNIMNNQENVVQTTPKLGKIKNSSRVPSHIQNKLKIIIKKYPNGIWCRELPTKYSEEFNESLFYNKMGYRSVIHMCLDLEDIFKCFKESSYDFKLYDVETEREVVPYVEKSPVKIKEELPSFESLIHRLDWDSCKYFLHHKVLVLGDTIERYFIDNSIKKGDIISVQIAEIYDPSKFWTILQHVELNNLMDNLQVFYNENKERYLIPEYLIVTDLYCVIHVNNEYHRGLIVNVPDNRNFVKVYCIDYGSVATILKTQIWFLTESFSKLPAQAIRSRLADIYPPVENMTWSRLARSIFKNMTTMNVCEATVQHIHKNKMEIEFYIKKTPGCSTINEILVNDGYALYSNQKRLKKLEDPNCIPKVKYVHLFPTFEEIERNLVASIDDIVKFDNTDVTIDLFFPHYFTKYVDKETLDIMEQKERQNNSLKNPVDEFVSLDGLNLYKVKELQRNIYGDMYDEFKNDDTSDEEEIIEEPKYLSSKLKENKFINTKVIKDIYDYDSYGNTSSLRDYYGDLPVNSFYNINKNDMDVQTDLINDAKSTESFILDKPNEMIPLNVKNDDDNNKTYDLINLDVVLDNPLPVLLPEIVNSKISKTDSDDKIKNNLIDVPNVVKPPPGFEAQPYNNDIAAVYQSWSTANQTLSTTNQFYGNNTISRQHQQIFQQMSYQYPPIIIFNYNGIQNIPNNGCNFNRGPSNGRRY